MFVIKRNQLLIVSLFILVLVAGVFNFVDRKDESSQLLEEAENIFMQTDLIIDDEKAQASTKLDSGNIDESDDNTDDIGLATLVSSSEDDFFLEAKINRDETREERKEWLMDLINTAAQTDETKENAMSEIVEIQQIMEKEMQVESLIEAKGFGSTYVRIDDDQVDVVVSKQNLTQNEISQIVDITERQTGFKSKNIKISSLKAGE